MSQQTGLTRAHPNPPDSSAARSPGPSPPLTVPGNIDPVQTGWLRITQAHPDIHKTTFRRPAGHPEMNGGWRLRTMGACPRRPIRSNDAAPTAPRTSI
ncbi:hypothetical protein Srufu_044170 [Streptomyces libani subsp. rufus]|nr:hypothetical protein Srufu_044170 [Streptomyces libani subsp. rufus]